LTGISVTAAASRADTAPPRRRRAATAAWTAGTAVTAVVLFGCYLRQSRTVAVGSDGASQALQGWDLLHGNPLLHGWWVTDVSFYTTELPQYAVIEAARGLNADVIHVAGAMTYTLLVLAAALLARGRTAGRAGLARAALTAGIMLAPQLGPATQTLVLSPDHTGTAVPVLLILLLIDRWRPLDRPPLLDRPLVTARLPVTGRLRPTSRGSRAGGRPGDHAAVRWLVPALVWVGLTWTAVADAMTIFIAVIPFVLACAIRLACRRRQAAGWPEFVLAVAALLAVPAELLVTALIRANGGWQVNGLHTALAGAGQLAGNARLTGQGLLELFGADVFGAPRGLGTALAAVHLAGVILAAAGVLAAARGFTRRAGLIEQLLLAGIIIDLASYLAGVQAVNLLSTREIAPVLPFAAVLAGRTLAGPLTAAPQRRSARRYARQCALCAALALYAAGLGYAAARPAAAPQYAGLAGWLRAHQLTDGLSDYHQANIVTLESGGAVTLRAVAPAGHGRLAGYAWNASTAWFNPAAHTATFLVLGAPGTPGASGLTAARAVATFGRPARSYHYQQYEVLLWPRGTNLLDRLRAG